MPQEPLISPKEISENINAMLKKVMTNSWIYPFVQIHTNI